MEVKEAQGNYTATDTAVVTVAETVAVASGEVLAPDNSTFCYIIAYANLSTGAATTGLTARIRRGATAAGAVVGDAVGTAAGAGVGEQIIVHKAEARSNVDTVEYCLTVEATAATGNGTIRDAGILVFIL